MDTKKRTIVTILFFAFLLGSLGSSFAFGQDQKDGDEPETEEETKKDNRSQDLVKVAAALFEIAGAITNILWDVVVQDIPLTWLEKGFDKKEKKVWSDWKGLYDDFTDVFDGQIGQMIERHTGFNANGDGFENLLANTKNVLLFAQDSVYYTEYLDKTIIGKIRKKDQAKSLDKPKTPEGDPPKPPEGDPQKPPDNPEAEAQKFRELLLEDQAAAIYQNMGNNRKDTKLALDDGLLRRKEDIRKKEGFINLLTQIKRDEDDRFKQMTKRMEGLNEAAKSKKVEGENAKDGEEVTNTTELVGTLVTAAQDLSMIGDEINQMIRYSREMETQKELDERIVTIFEIGKEDK